MDITILDRDDAVVFHAGSGSDQAIIYDCIKIVQSTPGNLILKIEELESKSQIWILQN